jgi:hypothetical protein
MRRCVGTDLNVCPNESSGDHSVVILKHRCGRGPINTSHLEAARLPKLRNFSGPPLRVLFSSIRRRRRFTNFLFNGNVGLIVFLIRKLTTLLHA